jgi:hypothetical protein
MWTRKVLLALSLCVTVPACASLGKNTKVEQREATTVLVENQALLDMTIYVLRGSQRIRLGTATGLTNTRFTIPPGVMGGLTSLRFLADPIGSNRTPISEEITVEVGDEVVLRIPPY